MPGWALSSSALFCVRGAQNMMGLLKQQYPSQLMPQLAARSQEALGAAAAAFPTARAVDPSGLQLFVSAVEARARSPISDPRSLIPHRLTIALQLAGIDLFALTQHAWRLEQGQ